MTTSNYLISLQNDKTNLATKLSEKGVEVTGDETFTELVPKIDEIKSGSNDFTISDASYLFYGGARMDVFSNLISLCNNITRCIYMFYDTPIQYVSIDLSGFDTSSVEYMNSMFGQCKAKEINLTNLCTSNVKDMRSMFYNTPNLISIDLSGFDTSSVKYMNSMFYMLSKNITNLDLSNFDTSNVLNVTQMFGMTGLETINLDGCNFEKTSELSNWFQYITTLKNLNFGSNVGKGFTIHRNNYSNYTLDFTYAKSLTHDSLMSIINNLYDLNLTYDVANGETLYTQQLKIGADNIAKLTSEEIAIATNKGWTVS